MRRQYGETELVLQAPPIVSVESQHNALERTKRSLFSFFNCSVLIMTDEYTSATLGHLHEKINWKYVNYLVIHKHGYVRSSQRPGTLTLQSTLPYVVGHVT